MSSDGNNEPIYANLTAEGEEAKPLEIESFCVNCHQNGTTRILSTKIPFYKQVILIAFNCDHCGFSNNELQSGEQAQEYGREITLFVNGAIDLNRQVVKSEFAEVSIPELDLLIPSKSQTGEITTVEGILQRVITGLRQDQEFRYINDQRNAIKIDEFIKKVENLLDLKVTFTLKIRDSSGNSFVQNPIPFHADPHCIITNFTRSLADRQLLGLADDHQIEEPQCSSEIVSYEDAKNEVFRFQSDCPNCGARVETRMKPTDIPYFTTLIIMCTTCDVCGWKSNEVKSGAAIRDYGCKITVFIKEGVDLSRDVLKSDTCSMSIPELELEVGPGALSGRFTTVEGLLTATKEQLSAQYKIGQTKCNSEILQEQSQFFFGDSMGGDDSKKIVKLFEKFDQILSLERNVHIVLDDPTGNSYVQSLTAPIDDKRLTKEFYERSEEQNEKLGLNDMKTENYETLKPIEEHDEAQ